MSSLIKKLLIIYVLLLIVLTFISIFASVWSSDVRSALEPVGQNINNTGNGAYTWVFATPIYNATFTCNSNAYSFGQFTAQGVQRIYNSTAINENIAALDFYAYVPSGANARWTLFNLFNGGTETLAADDFGGTLYVYSASLGLFFTMAETFDACVHYQFYWTGTVFKGYKNGAYAGQFNWTGYPNGYTWNFGTGTIFPYQSCNCYMNDIILSTTDYEGTPIVPVQQTSTVTPTYTVTETYTPTFTPTFTPTGTPTYTVTLTHSQTYTPTYTPSFTPTKTKTATITPSKTMTPTVTITPFTLITRTPTYTPTRFYILMPVPTTTATAFVFVRCKKSASAVKYRMINKYTNHTLDFGNTLNISADSNYYVVPTRRNDGIFNTVQGIRAVSTYGVTIQEPIEVYTGPEAVSYAGSHK